MAIEKSDVETFLNSVHDRVTDFALEHNAFLADLMRGDDWSFVIKSHALIEAIVTQNLIKRSGDIRYRRMYERMSISRKAATLKDLGICSSQEKRFIDFYSSLRNRLVHNVDELAFSFEKHVAQMNTRQRNEFDRSMRLERKTGDNRGPYETLLFENTKYALWLTILRLLIVLFSDGELEHGKKELAKLDSETSERILKDRHPEMFLGFAAASVSSSENES